MDTKRIPFAQEDERRIASAATWGMIVATTAIATSVLSVVFSLRQILAFMDVAGLMMAAPLVQAIVTILLNVWLLQASLSFRKVALTDEADQAHLLAGFRKLRAYFMIQVILIMLVVVGGLLFTIVF
jgi:hypothetical protein